jgi:signal peptidase I
MRWPSLRRSRNERAAPDKPKESAGGLLRFLVLLLVFAWALRSLVVAPFNIPSGSMLPTLYIGDYLLVAKWPYGYSRYSFLFGFPPIEGRLLAHLPKRGDVVVFRHPKENEDLIKRVIGLPGDTVEVKGGELILNGKPVPREELDPAAIPISANSPCRVVAPASPMLGRTADGRAACLYPAYRETLPEGVSYTVLDQVDTAQADNFPATRVPAGRLFLMGDNRDDSADSRFSLEEGGIGMVPTENLVGRAMVTFWSTDGSASYWKPWTWFTALRGDRIGNGYSGGSDER